MYFLSENLTRAAELQVGALQFAVSVGTKCGEETTGARFLEEIIRKASGNSKFLRDYCYFGCHRGDMSWVQAMYKVVLQMLIDTNKHRKANNKINLNNQTTSPNRKCQICRLPIRFAAVLVCKLYASTSCTMTNRWRGVTTVSGQPITYYQ